MLENSRSRTKQYSSEQLLDSYCVSLGETGRKTKDERRGVVAVRASCRCKYYSE